MSRSLREVLGLPVVARSTAEQLGVVTGLVVNPTKRRTEAVHIGGPKRHPRFIDWSAIVSFGEDAIIVDDSDAVREANSDTEQHVAAGHTTLLDQRVLDDLGDELGTLHDVDFDTQTGAIDTLRLDNLELDGTQFVGVGTYAIVITHTNS
jgi:uncharacterized protein YrrD